MRMRCNLVNGNAMVGIYLESLGPDELLMPIRRSETCHFVGSRSQLFKLSSFCTKDRNPDQDSGRCFVSTFTFQNLKSKVKTKYY